MSDLTPHQRMLLSKQLMGEQFNRETPQDYPVADRSSLLPLATYGNGHTGLAFPGFIAEDIPNALTAPSRAYRGEMGDYLDNRDQFIGEGLNFAGTAAVGGSVVPKPTNAAGMFGGRLAKTADQNALARAEKMAAEGAPREFTLPGTIVAEAGDQATIPGIRAYHGSPHDFDRFDISKIGTGEGNQAFGSGLYFAENEGVARTYKGAGNPGYQDIGVVRRIEEALKEAGGDENAARNLLNTKAMSATGRERQQLFDAYNNFNEARTPGRLYEVNIHANPDDFLDWDKPLSQQSDKIRSALHDVLKPNKFDVEQAADGRWHSTIDGERFGPLAGFDREADARLAAESSRKNNNNIGKQLVDAPDLLNGNDLYQKYGIPGIRYLDQGSRSAGEGSRNYVVFDDNLISILRKYGLLGMLGGGAAALAGGEPAEAADRQAIAKALMQ